MTGNNTALTLLEEAVLTSVNVEHICDMTLPFATNTLFSVPAGKRQIISAQAGAVSGPHLNGTVASGAIGSALWTQDGIIAGEMTGAIHTSDGADIFLKGYGKIKQVTPELQDRLAKNEAFSWKEIAPNWNSFFFETTAEKYLWLNAVNAISKIEFTDTAVIVRLYKLL